MKRLLPRCCLSVVQLSLCVLFTILIACNKEAGYKKIVAEVGFPADVTSVDIPDNVNVLTFTELEISTLNDNTAYDVYFRFEDPTVIGRELRTNHPTYRDPLTNLLYYRIVVARGMKKAALALIPNNRSTGDVAIKVILEEDMSGKDNYILRGNRNLTVNYIDK